MSAGERPIRVAIVGGGCAAMAAAFELSRPEHDGRFEVTVYQLGWRLGGKGASGRGPYGRIEEHGLHVWMGWYENAFRMMRECYAELGRDWQEAFTPAPLVAVTDRLNDHEWVPWTRIFPPAEGLPGDGACQGQRWTVGHYMARSAELLRALVVSLEPNVAAATTRERPRDALASISDLLRYGEIATLGGIAHAASLMQTLFESVRAPASAAPLAVVDALGASAGRILEGRLERDLTARRIWQVLDLTLATLRGNLRSGVMTDPRGFDALDEYECREWLLLNGASPRSVDSAYLRGLYDLGFSYESGDATKPSVSAAQALRGYLRSFFTYRGAFFWKMNGGMGDVVFAPLYEVLRARGVRFEFFHRLRNVRLGHEGGAGSGVMPHVAALEFDVQARVKGSGLYEPLLDVAGMRCWPSQPHYAQLADGERLRREGWNFESHWEVRAAGKRTLEVRTDFDFVVLGVGLGAIPFVCRDLVERDPRWRAMVDNVKTVATQGLQLWLNTPTEELGWTGPPITLSGFVKPFETWADMRHLIDRESWAERPRGIAYFCGVLPEPIGPSPADPAYRDNARRAVLDNARRFLERDIRHLWPAAVDDDGVFRWDLLCSTAAGAERLESQYWTANVEPTDRYTLALPGSSAFRISPLDTTYDNLTVCGDWTDCGFNSGCVEAAVMSGLLAAHALSGKPALEDIVGFDHP